MTTKKSKLLPSRSALNRLSKKPGTILDYAKSLPTAPGGPTTNIVRNLQMPKKK